MTFSIGLSNEWHPTRNGSLKLVGLSPNSHRKVWWRCRQGHEWEAMIHNRSHGSACPACSGRIASSQNNLKTQEGNSVLLREWHPRNLEGPEAFLPKSNAKVWWKCQFGHEWKAMISSRSRGSGCPACKKKVPTSDYNLGSAAPQLVSEWNSKNGKRPQDFLPKSNAKVWWKCRFGHEWKAIISNRTRGSGCPRCNRKNPEGGVNLALSFPILAGEWHLKNNGRPEHFLASSEEVVQWVCESAHVYNEKIKNRTAGEGCPFCSGKMQVPVKNLRPKKSPNN